MERQTVNKKLVKRSLSNYDEAMNIRFKRDAELCIAYLNQTVKNENHQAFLIALQNVLTARVGDFSTIAKKAKVSEKDIEHVFSDEPNPTINALIKLLNLMNLQFAIPEVQQTKKAKKPVATKAKKR